MHYFLVEMMLKKSNSSHQENLFGTDLLLQLDPNDPLHKLSPAMPWHTFKEAFVNHYKKLLLCQFT
jgi:transposase, IS5 family